MRITFKQPLSLAILIAGVLGFLSDAQAEQSKKKKSQEEIKIQVPFENSGSLFYTSPNKLNKNSQELWSLKNLYLNSQNEECFELAQKIKKKHKILVGWILNQQGECLTRLASKKFEKYQIQFLKSIRESHTEWQSTSAQEPLRKQIFQNLILWSRTGPAQPVLQYFEWTLDSVEGWSAEQNSVLYEAFGDYYVRIKRIDLARSAYKRAYTFFARSSLAAKINEEGYNVTSPAICTQQEETSKSQIFTQLSNQEYKAKNEIDKALEQLEPRCRTKATNEFFNALVAKYLKTNSDKRGELAAQFLLFTDDYLVPWIESQQFKSPVEDLDPLLKEKRFSDKVKSTLLMTLGRAFFDEFKLPQAQEKYEDALKLNLSATQAEEIHYRLALIFMRTRVVNRARDEWKAVLKSATGELKIRSLYWLRQSLLKLEEKDEAEKVGSELLLVSPDSIWGLKVGLEKSNGVLRFFESSKESPWPKEDLFVDSKLKKSVERFESLAQAGWWFEAQKELRAWPIPISRSDRWSRIQMHCRVLDYIGAYALMKEDELLQSLPKNWVAQLFPKEFEEFVTREARLNGLHPHFVWSVMKQESAFYPYARSPAKAMGLLQLLGDTAKEMSKIVRLNKFRPEDLYQPAVNIKLGTTYLNRLLKKYQNHVPLTLVAYNAGMGRLDRWLKKRGDLKAEIQSKQELFEDLWVEEIPWKESQTYVRRILRNWLIMKAIYEPGSQSQSPVWSEVLITPSDPPK